MAKINEVIERQILYTYVGNIHSKVEVIFIDKSNKKVYCSVDGNYNQWFSEPSFGKLLLNKKRK